MNPRYIIFVSIAVLAIVAFRIFQGNNPGVISSNQSPIVVNSGAVVPQPVPVETVILREKETRDYTLGLVNNEGKLKIIHGTGSKLIVHFAANNTMSLTASLKTPGNEPKNIGMSQIIGPDGTSDGPFGRDLETKLTQTGEYQLIISESLMAEASGSGEVDFSMMLQ